MEYLELMKEAEAKYNEATVIEATAATEKRELTVEELNTVRGVLNESLELKSQGDELYELEQNKKALKSAFTNPIWKHPMGEDTGVKSSDEINSIELKHQKALDSYLRTGSDIEMKKLSQEYPELKALSRLTDPAGGYLVSAEMSTTLLKRRDIQDAIRPLAQVFVSSKATFPIPAWDDNWTMEMVSEMAAISEETGDVAGQIVLTPHKAAKLLKISEELLDDSDFNLEPLIGERFGRALGRFQLTQWINGSGDKQPEGILNGGIIDHDIETADSGVIVGNDIQDIIYNLTPEYRTPEARFVIPTATMKQIVLLKDLSGGAGTGRYLWQPSFQAGQPGLLIGHPVIEVADAYWPTISADGDPLLIFGDISQYAIYDRKGFSIKRLNELYAVNGLVGFIVTARFDGKVTDINAFLRLNRT